MIREKQKGCLSTERKTYSLVWYILTRDIIDEQAKGKRHASDPGYSNKFRGELMGEYYKEE